MRRYFKFVRNVGGRLGRQWKCRKEFFKYGKPYDSTVRFETTRVEDQAAWLLS